MIKKTILSLVVGFLFVSNGLYAQDSEMQNGVVLNVKGIATPLCLFVFDDVAYLEELNAVREPFAYFKLSPSQVSRVVTVRKGTEEWRAIMSLVPSFSQRVERVQVFEVKNN